MTSTVEGTARDAVLATAGEMLKLGKVQLVETGMVKNDGEMLGAVVSVLITVLCQCMTREDVETFLAEVMSENTKLAPDGTMLN